MALKFMLGTPALDMTFADYDRVDILELFLVLTARSLCDFCFTTGFAALGLLQDYMVVLLTLFYMRDTCWKKNVGLMQEASRAC